MIIRMIRNNIEFDYYNVTRIEEQGDFILLDGAKNMISCNMDGEWFANYNAVFVNGKTVAKMEVFL